ncbi:MAG: lytic transglycosylase domain-containing protein [Verrucomicrobiia bacterium]|jgi:soluble lytic murein transglycosylase
MSRRGKKALTGLAFVVVTVIAIIWIWRFYLQWKEDSFDKEILAAAAYYNVDPALIKAIIWRESRFNPNAIGRKGEIGLMQIMPATAKDWAAAEKINSLVFTDLFNPQKNIMCGTWYVRKLLRRYQSADNPLPYALADYNAGRGNVLKWAKDAAATNSIAFIGQIGFPSTREYVIAIVERYRYYRENWMPRVATNQTNLNR